MIYYLIKKLLKREWNFFYDKIRKNNNKENIGINEPLDILINELINIDTEKASIKICDELYDLLIVDKQQKKQNINDKFFQINN